MTLFVRQKTEDGVVGKVSQEWYHGCFAGASKEKKVLIGNMTGERKHGWENTSLMGTRDIEDTKLYKFVAPGIIEKYAVLKLQERVTANT